MKKARFLSLALVVLTLFATPAVAATKTTTTTTTVTTTTTTTTVTTSDSNSKLKFEKWYVVMPEMNIRAQPDKPGGIATLRAGDEVEVTGQDDIWATFKFVDPADGKKKNGCTWAGAISQGIRIHLAEDAFIYHKIGASQKDFGMISTWREPTDPDLLILWEETYNGEDWLYVLSLEDCRGGYMKADAKYEIVK